MTTDKKAPKTILSQKCYTLYKKLLINFVSSNLKVQLYRTHNNGSLFSDFLLLCRTYFVICTMYPASFNPNSELVQPKLTFFEA